MQQADAEFRQGNYQKAIHLYSQFIQNRNAATLQVTVALLNLSSAYFSSNQYNQCLKTTKKYLEQIKQLNQEPKVQAFILYCRSLIKLKKLLSHEEHQLINEAQQTFPYHKVLQQSIKTVKQLQISQNQDQYMDKIFEKLLCDPRMRNYLTDQSFLTKVQKIIRNPSLAGALIKTDKRLQNITEVILMAEEEDENPNLTTK